MLKKLHLHIHSITYQFIYHSFFHKLLKKKRSFFSTNKTELLYPQNLRRIQQPCFSLKQYRILFSHKGINPMTTAPEPSSHHLWFSGFPEELHLPATCKVCLTDPDVHHRSLRYRIPAGRSHHRSLLLPDTG